MNAVEADVVIVGSGVAGALVAERLARAGIGVAVLEAGSRIDRAQALGRYFNAPIKTPESPYLATPEADFPLSADRGHWYRQSGPDTFKSTYLKAVGGTTWHWLGTCLRFLPNDFRLKSLYGRGVDWPIGYDELEPFYLEAESELGVAGDSNEDLGSPRSCCNILTLIENVCSVGSAENNRQTPNLCIATFLTLFYCLCSYYTLQLALCLSQSVISHRGLLLAV